MGDIKNQKIKAVIFDMDGVLIDARDWHYQALNEALNPLWLFHQYGITFINF